MSETILRAQGIGKKYILQHRSQRAGHGSLSETIVGATTAAARRLVGRGNARTRAREEFWALRGVNLEIAVGDVVGIIGRNGAGKSTLLKVISRITEPTEGSILLRGRVASLLEVGTGFHPELTGRENVFLNGAILGMSKAEIRAKFDEIVAFAEIERFLDTPVKRYSSGMYVRLAFAVAAHLEPEILIIDEVLAVGDVAFQRKCLERMDEVARQGRTILFVSHNLGLIRMLCRRGVVLDGGSVKFDGTAVDAVDHYLRALEASATTDLLEHQQRRGSGKVRIAGIDIDTPTGASALEPGRPARFVFRTTGDLPGLTCSFTIYDSLGQPVTFFDSAVPSTADVTAEGRPGFVCELDVLTLMPGRYRINAALTCDGELQDHLEGAATLEVSEGLAGARPIVAAPGYGSTFMNHRWIRSR
jgi:lipopolysaccharide transport system ATP-binding protein